MPNIDLQHFKTYGYAAVKNVFSKDEVLHLREHLGKVKHRALQTNSFETDPKCPNLRLILGDVLSHQELAPLDYVLLDDRILAIARQILGPQLVYFGDSSIQAGEGIRGFHKDNVDRTDPNGPDWRGEYQLIRFGIYAQDHSHHSGGLKIRLKSHNFCSNHLGRAVNLATESGDVVVWYLRTTHSGNNVRIRYMPDLCMHPRIETLMPYSWRVPEELERFAVFGTFAAPGDHLERYLKYMEGRSDYRPHLLRGGWNTDLHEFLRRKNVEMRKPIEDFGQLQDTA